MIMYDKITHLDIGQRYTNLIQDTLSTDPAWPLEILRSTELSIGHLNNPRRRRKHCGRRAGIRNRLRKRARSPPLPSILLANVQSLENKMDDLRARISFQRDINIFCLTETWLTPSVPDTAVTPSDNFSVLRMDRTAEAGKTKGGGVCFMTNKKWCDPRNISILSCSCSPHLEHLSIICRPFYLPREFSSIVVTAVYIPPQADTSLALSKLHDVLSGYINKHPDAVFIIAGDYNKAKVKKVMPNFHQHISCPTRGPNKLDHCYTQFKNAYKAHSLPAFGKSESHFQLNDSRHMWQGLKTICSSGNNSSAEVRADPLLAEELNTFYGCFECNGGATLPISASGSSRQSSDDYAITLSEDEVRRELKRVNVRKAAGPDGITGRVLRSCADQLAGLFTSIFNESLATSVVPTSFKKCVIIPVPKNSKPSCLNDYLDDSHSGKRVYCS